MKLSEKLTWRMFNLIVLLGVVVATCCNNYTLHRREVMCEREYDYLVVQTMRAKAAQEAQRVANNALIANQLQDAQMLQMQMHINVLEKTLMDAMWGEWETEPADETTDDDVIHYNQPNCGFQCLKILQGDKCIYDCDKGVDLCGEAERCKSDSQN